MPGVRAGVWKYSADLWVGQVAVRSHRWVTGVGLRAWGAIHLYIGDFPSAQCLSTCGNRQSTETPQNSRSFSSGPTAPATNFSPLPGLPVGSTAGDYAGGWGWPGGWRAGWPSRWRGGWRGCGMGWILRGRELGVRGDGRGKWQKRSGFSHQRSALRVRVNQREMGEEGRFQASAGKLRFSAVLCALTSVRCIF